MKSRKSRQPPPRLEKRYRPTPDELAAALQEALAWRESWRQELTAPLKGEREAAALVTPPGTSAGPGRRPKFASAIARAELGRHYWDARKAGAPKARRRRSQS